MQGWWVADLIDAGRGAYLVSWIFWVIVSVCLHELAHGWMAIRKGDLTPRETGHMTWNPLVHMGVWSLAALALVGIAWGLMPVNPSRMRGRFAEGQVAAAGPAMNVGLAVVSAIVAGVWMGVEARADPTADPSNIVNFWYVGAWLNLVLAAFNLLPVPPLDGSRILADISPDFRRLTLDPRFSQGAFIVVIVLVVIGGFGFLFDVAQGISIQAVHAVAGVVAG